MADIVSINGEVLPAPGEPYPEVVEALRTMLQRAEAGELIGVRIAALRQDRLPTGMVAGRANYALLGMHYSMSVDLSNELTAADIYVEREAPPTDEGA